VQPERDARVKRAQRGQIPWGRVDLDAEVPADHEVRVIAAVVAKLDLRGRYADVRARGEIAGAPPPTPRSSSGSGSMSPGTASARVARSRGSSSSTPPTRWLCGGVAVADHRLDDVRSDTVTSSASS
jgi:hypothetical protein